MDKIDFIKQFIKHPTSIGAIAPSTEELAEQMVAPIKLDRIKTIVEYGAGTGVFTQYVSDRIDHKKTLFFSFEIDEKFHEISSQKVPEIEILKDSASNVCKQLRRRGKKHTDAIISGLPWAVFPNDLQDEILEATLRALKPGGIFTTFTYIHSFYLPAACRIRSKLKKNFAEVSISPVVWANMPPAIVYWCKK